MLTVMQDPKVCEPKDFCRPPIDCFLLISNILVIVSKILILNYKQS